MEKDNELQILDEMLEKIVGGGGTKKAIYRVLGVLVPVLTVTAAVVGLAVWNKDKILKIFNRSTQHNTTLETTTPITTTEVPQPAAPTVPTPAAARIPNPVPAAVAPAPQPIQQPTAQAVAPIPEASTTHHIFKLGEITNFDNGSVTGYVPMCNRIPILQEIVEMYGNPPHSIPACQKLAMELEPKLKTVDEQHFVYDEHTMKKIQSIRNFIARFSAITHNF